MRKRFRSGVIVLGILTSTAGCARETPTAPSALSVDALGASSTALTATSYPVVTLQADLTANPARVTVQARSKVVMVNNSARYVRVRSSNCTEFLTMGLQPGVSQHTMPFYPAGKTCDYFVWDTNWSRRIFVGQVVVQ